MAIMATTMVAVIAGSLAYWNQTHIIDNPFETGGKFGATVIEDFIPDGEWLPGAEVDKVVQVENTGEQDIIIRVKMDEKWVRKGENNPYKQFSAVPDKDVYVVEQIDAEDGKTAADKSVVIKNFSASTNWVDGQDGWFYYKVNLAKGKITDKWLESVALIDDLDVGAKEVLHYVTTEKNITNDTVWVPYNPTEGMPKEFNEMPVLHNKTEVVYKKDAEKNELIGYLNSNYTLTITAQTVQASKEAVMATFEFTEKEVEDLAVDWKFAD